LPLFGWGVLFFVLLVLGTAAVVLTGRQRGFREALESLLVPLVISGIVIVWGLPALNDGQGIPVRGYGTMLVAAAAAGTWLSVIRGRKIGIDADTIVALGLEVFLAGIAGARIFFVLEYHEQFFSPDKSLLQSILAIINIPAGGLVVFGALPTASIAAWMFSKRRHISITQLADCIAPGLLVGLSLGRIGCFLNGCCYGGLCELPWAVEFPAGSPPWFDQVSRGLISKPGIDGSTVQTLPIHPTQLYASLDAALLALLAIAFTPFARRDGEVFALIITLHPISRILLEEIRIDEPPALGTPLSISQLMSVGILASAMVFWWWLSRQPQLKPRQQTLQTTAKEH
jgi:phosphatidylglycerol:prolipoprotein diacylglycerol transferase